MKIKLEYLREPKLRFGSFFEHEDTKTGLAEYGPFGKSVAGLHPTGIRLGCVGTRQGISVAREWVDTCSRPIESQNIKTVRSKSVKTPLFDEEYNPTEEVRQRFEKILNRDFIGFNNASEFNCSFHVNDRWDRVVQPRELQEVLSTENDIERIKALVDLVNDRITSLTTTSPTPDIILVAIPPEVIEKAHSVHLGGNYHLNFRRALKAQAMQQRNPIPLQLVRESTLEGKGSLQEIATRAWNFCTAQYYKAEGVPWSPISLEAETCYVGISFFVTQAEQGIAKVRSSLAQAFDYLGQGLVLRGEQFEWDTSKLGKSPHLTSEQARRLIRGVLEEYIKVKGTPPRRVVIHKSSMFWGAEHGIHNEIEGFYGGIDEVFPRCETDFVALRQSDVRLFREGLYPPLRGTYVAIEDAKHLVYTMGFIPYLETSPSSYVPRPWEIIQHIGGSAAKDLAREILGLTKMNFNNCAFADGYPITLSFSSKVGEIMKHVPEGGSIQASYKFYM